MSLFSESFSQLAVIVISGDSKQTQAIFETFFCALQGQVTLIGITSKDVCDDDDALDIELRAMFGGETRFADW